MADVLRDRLNQMAEVGKCNIASIRAEFEKLDVHVEAEDGLILFKHRSNETATDPLIKECCGTIVTYNASNDGESDFIVPGSVDYVCRPVYRHERGKILNVWRKRFDWCVSSSDFINADKVFPDGPDNKSYGDRFRDACDKLCGVCFPMTGFKRLCVKLDKTVQMTGHKLTFMFSRSADGYLVHEGTRDNVTGEIIDFDFNNYFEFEGGAMEYHSAMHLE